MQWLVREAQAIVRTTGPATPTPDKLSSLLVAAAVSTRIDVRRYPLGRRQPHLARERLAVNLPERHIGYEWWGEALGGRRLEAGVKPPPDSPWRTPSFAAYSAHMSTPEFRTAIADFEARARAGGALALMCAETVWWRCHRRLIADALVLDGLEVEHLIDRAPGRPHRHSKLGGAANLQAKPRMCLPCGCMDAHLEMGKSNITYQDVKAAADENGNTVAETVDIIERTIAKDRGEHPPEYGASSGGS